MALNTEYLKSAQGILKILEFVSVFCQIKPFIIRFLGQYLQFR